MERVDAAPGVQGVVGVAVVAGGLHLAGGADAVAHIHLVAADAHNEHHHQHGCKQDDWPAGR